MSSSKEKGASRGPYLNGLGLMMITSDYCPYTEVDDDNDENDDENDDDDDDDDDDRGVNFNNP